MKYKENLSYIFSRTTEKEFFSRNTIELFCTLDKIRRSGLFESNHIIIFTIYLSRFKKCKKLMVVKELLAKILSKIRDEGIKVLDESILKENSWFLINDSLEEIKTIYIFRSDGQLLISENGDITKAKWESFQHATSSLVLEINNLSVLMNIIYLNTDYLILQKDGTEIITVFVKQQKYLAKLPNELVEDSRMNMLKILHEDLNRKNLNSNLGYKSLEIDDLEEDNIIENNRDDYGFKIIGNDDLMGVELIGISRLRCKLKDEDIILKAIDSKRIEIYSRLQVDEILKHGHVWKFIRIL